MSDVIDLDQILPTDEDVADYQRRGWYISRPIVPDDMLDAAIEGSERFYAGGFDDGPPIPEWCHPKVPPPPGLRKNDYASLWNRELTALVRFPAIAAIAARLSGATSIRLWHDQLLFKPPQGAGADGEQAPGNVGWHTDRSYWMAATSEDMLTAWVPFTTITDDMGPLMVLDGSHRWHDDRDHRQFFRQDLDEMESELGRPGRRLVKVPLLLERGQVSFHHCRTFHGSGPNRSSVPRRSIAIHLQPGDNRFSGRRDADGQLVYHANNEVCRSVDGVPDYADPRYCPTLWPAVNANE